MDVQEKAVKAAAQADAATREYIEPLDLETYKDLSRAMMESKTLLDTLKAQINEAESKLISANGAASAFSAFIQKKYNLKDTSKIDAESGEIER